MSSRRLGRQKNVTLKTSSRRLQDVFSTSSPRRMFAGMIVHKDAMFFSLKMSVNLSQYRGIIGLFNVSSIIMIKFKNRTVSRLYYLCNTNQVSKNIYFFVVLLFSVLLYYFRQKNPKSHSPVPV